MLVISQNLVLPTQEAALPSGTPLILWDSIVTISNVAADSEDADYPVTNLANPATNQEWRAGSVGAVEITVTPETADDIDAVGIARHNWGSAGIAAEVGYYDDEAWVSLAGPQVPANDEPLLFWFTAQPLASVVIKLSTGSDVAMAAVLYVGKLLVMERGVDADKDYANPRFARRTETVTSRSERGDFLGRTVTSRYIDGIEHVYSHLTPDWYRSYADPFVAACADRPFFYAQRPDDYPAEVAFAWFTDDPVPMTNPATRRKRLLLKMGGIVE